MDAERQSAKPKPFDLSRILHRLFIIVVIGVLGNLAFALYNSSTDPVALMGNFTLGFLILALMLAIAPWFGHCFRIIIWSRLLGNRLSTTEAFKIAVATDLGAAITPTVIGGAPIKLGMLIQSGFRPGVAATLVALGSFEELLFYLVTIPLAVVLNADKLSPYVNNLTLKLLSMGDVVISGVGFLIVGAVFLIPTYRQRKVKRSPFAKRMINLVTTARKGLCEVKKDFKEITLIIWRKGKLLFVVSFFATCLQWLCRYAILNSLILGLGIKTDHIELFLRQWLVFAAMVFMPTPGATGGAELTFYYVFESILPAEAIAVVIASWRFLTYYLIMLVAALIVLVLTKMPAYKTKKTVIPL